MIKLIAAFVAALALYAALFAFVPISHATAIVLPWLDQLGEFSFGGVSSITVFAIIMGK